MDHHDEARSTANQRQIDHFVGAAGKRQWHRNAKRLRGFEIDDQLKLRRLQDRRSAGLPPQS